MKKTTIIRTVTVSQSVELFIGVVPDLQARGYEVVSLSSPGPELQRLKDMGVRCLEVPMERHISVVRDIRSLWRIIRVFRREKPYLVHSMTPKAGMLCMVAAWICRVPKRVHTFTGLVWPTESGVKRRILMFTDWITCFCATDINPEGKGVMEDLRNHITRKTMKVLGYGNVRGVDMMRFSLRPEVEAKAELLRRKDVFAFLFVGRIVSDKGINELVEAFIRLLKDGCKVRLWLVGDFEKSLDPLKESTERIINTTPEIETLGPVLGDDLVVRYAAADCYVFPSYREGFPNTVLEAGAMGLPSIVTDINGSREIIVNGENGMIIPSKDVDALYKAMRAMLDDVDDRNRMAKNARPMVESRYEQDYVRKCLLDFYKKLIDSSELMQ